MYTVVAAAAPLSMDVLLTLIATLLVAFLIGVEQGYYGGLFAKFHLVWDFEVPWEIFVGTILCVIGVLRGGGPGRYLSALGGACFVVFVSTVARGIGYYWKHPEEREQADDEQDAP